MAASSPTDWPAVADHFVAAWQATPVPTQIAALLALVLIAVLLPGRWWPWRGERAEDPRLLKDAYGQVIRQIMLELAATVSGLRDSVDRFADGMERHGVESTALLKEQGQMLERLSRAVVDLGSELPDCGSCPRAL
ncbi:hypothetical protein GALL_207830 [mine drainage metagenome]|uniref:Uncharacterized protein n=1 Tax=mine drainage metagenome TaxID=410659 RepID=A0A1J5SAG3_9ZZZZ